MDGLLAFLEEMVIEITLKVVTGKMFTRLKNRMLKTVPQRMIVSVPTDGHFVREGDAEKNVSFNVLFTKTWPMVINIGNIEYEVLYDYRVAQRRSYKPNRTMSRSDNQTRVDLLYNPMESPLGIPPSPDKWQIRGKATLESVYGTTTVEFSSTRNLAVTHDTDWNTLRGKTNVSS